MKKACFFAAMAGLVPMLTCVTQAGAQTITDRQMNQQRRIEQGVESGALTPRETQRLEREQGRIENAKERARSDGYVSPQERKRIKRLQNKANRDIYRAKHNQRRAQPLPAQP